MKKLLCAGVLALSGCAGWGPRPPVERMYVIECGENRVNDLSQWTPGRNVGQAHTFGDFCYLIKHTRGWMLWDSGNADRIAALPGGVSAPVLGGITATMRKPLADSLKEIGVEPGDIRYFAMSHSHGDHSGNAGLFAGALLFIQAPEYAAAFGPAPQKYGFSAGNFAKLRDARVEKLDGDHDVFGDGSVVIKSTPGHTPGHQSLLVRLPRRGPVLLTGDLVHLVYSWENSVVPGFNFDPAASRRSIAAMKQLVKETGAQVWVNHDREQHILIPKSPNFVE